MTLQGTGDIVQHRKGRTEGENERGGGGRGDRERGVMRHMSRTKSSFGVFSVVSGVYFSLHYTPTPFTAEQQDRVYLAPQLNSASN